MAPNSSPRTTNPLLFLTGEVQIGKSTLITRVLDALQPNTGGFKTIGIDHEVRIFFPDGSAPCENNVVAIRTPPENRRSFPDVFDTVGVSLLQNPAELVLMDELGFFENNSPKFQKAVLRILDTDTPVLGVIKPRDTPFLNAVRNHPKTQVIEVTKENRDALYEPVLELLKKILQE